MMLLFISDVILDLQRRETAFILLFYLRQDG